MSEHDETERLGSVHKRPKWTCLRCLGRKSESCTDDNEDDGDEGDDDMVETEARPGRGEREKPTGRRPNRIYSLHVGAKFKMFVTLCVYSNEDPRVCEVFIDVAKAGAPFRTAMGAWAVMLSKALQWGMPLGEIVETYEGVQCPPRGLITCADTDEGAGVPAIHGQMAKSPWHAVALLARAETDELGRHRDFLAPVAAETPKTGDVLLDTLDEMHARTISDLKRSAQGEKVFSDVVQSPRLGEVHETWRGKCPHGHVALAVSEITDEGSPTGWYTPRADDCKLCPGHRAGASFKFEEPPGLPTKYQEPPNASS